MAPGAPDCLKSISMRMKLLYDRFQHIIRLSLFGHTHYEEFEVVRSFEDNKPIGVNHATSSVTTFVGNNPSFRAITIDVETKLPIRIETYTVNLAKANQDDEYAKFMFHHELTHEYGLQDLSPSSFLNLSHQFVTTPGLADLYLINKSARGPSGYAKAKDCDAG